VTRSSSSSRIQDDARHHLLGEAPPHVTVDSSKDSLLLVLGR